ncbi:Thiamine-phosphate synthase [Commensalibacter sp. Nvir]|uniref:thiamine phosphate synthase n=1 Tax=Commensalibacter sp. Nvir TaxID=3069817 RepID=UPI002D679846|nr:Thiamine-phosphate synthase [Commensalibacter sp. Nvir]
MERFYLITHSVRLIEQLAPLGVKLIQLRIKNTSEVELKSQIKAALHCCQFYKVQLVLNDYWHLALDLGINFVHLGQEDLQTADFEALRLAQVRFGISTHDHHELKRALALNPNYVALGPVYETLLIKMKWQPQGLERVRVWKNKIQSIPLVAIGGLTPARAKDVFFAGADSVAVVTDIHQAPDPVARCKEWLVIV